MPRGKRVKGNTKVYHIIIRGINKQDIFLDKQDFLKYIEEVNNTKEKYGYEIYAYAFMNDHVHFLLYDKNENISLAIQSLNVRYSIYYNKKYERTGHLFENRFKSKNVEDIKYLKSVLRYIHKNPENAGLKPYIWTSYNEYLYKTKLITTERILNLFEKNKEQAIKEFKKFHKNYNKYEDYYNNYELLSKITDENLIEIIRNIFKVYNPMKIQSYNKEEKNKIICNLLEIEGITKEQLSRITGINRKTIRNIEISSQKGQMPQKETSLMGKKE